MSIDKRHREILIVSKNLLSEELMADAVMIAITRRKGKSTETLVVSDGNMHTLRGVAQHIYDQFIDDPELEEDDEVDTTEEEGDDDDGAE